jgi:hypothetical protein
VIISSPFLRHKQCHPYTVFIGKKVVSSSRRRRRKRRKRRKIDTVWFPFW